MILIEMALQRDVNEGKEYANGVAHMPLMMRPRKNSYLWSIGQAWPVPVDEDEFVMRIEAFGPELEILKNKATTIKALAAPEQAPGILDWLPKVAPQVSKWMRAVGIHQIQY